MDGSYLIAALNTPYDDSVTTDYSNDPGIISRINNNINKYGIGKIFDYYGARATLVVLRRQVQWNLSKSN